MMLWKKRSNKQEYMKCQQRMCRSWATKASIPRIYFFLHMGEAACMCLSQSMVRDGLLDFMILSRSECRGLVFFNIPYFTCTIVMTFSSYLF
jgi:hypothetical protein